MKEILGNRGDCGASKDCTYMTRVHGFCEGAQTLTMQRQATHLCHDVHRVLNLWDARQKKKLSSFPGAATCQPQIWDCGGY